MVINFFFDVDGTIIPFGKDIPESAIKALFRAKELGHRIFLSTGRGTCEIDKRLHGLPFDGGIFSAGGKVICNGRTVYMRQFTLSERDYVMNFAKENNMEILIQTEEGTLLRRSTYECWNSAFDRYLGRRLDIPGLVVVDEFPDDLMMNKIVFFAMDRNIPTIKERLDPNFTIVGNTVGLPQDFLAELVLSDITKASGIERLIGYLGDNVDSVVAIGDGPNDIEMIQYASIGIAMGNGCDELKSIADFVTDDIESDGLRKAIEYAMEKLG